MSGPARTQSVTIPALGTQPTTGYFRKEDLDFIGFQTDADFDGTKLSWKGARTRAEADAGTWTPLEWDGALLEHTVAAVGDFSGVDPLHFSIPAYLIPVSDAAQAAGTPTVVKGFFKRFN